MDVLVIGRKPSTVHGSGNKRLSVLLILLFLPTPAKELVAVLLLCGRDTVSIEQCSVRGGNLLSLQKKWFLLKDCSQVL